jgi:hypothetical protein
MKIVFAPLMPFVSHPGRIAAVAVFFFSAGFLLTIWRRKIIWGSYSAGVAWASFAAWEQHCVEMRYNIRVDLGVIYPILAAFTIFASVRIFSAVSPQADIPRHYSLRALLILMTVVAIFLGGLAWYVR